jgi:hypothetical protein
MRSHLVHLGLFLVAALSGFATWGAFHAAGRHTAVAANRAPQVAPGAVLVVKTYLQALQSGHRATACRLLDLPSVCSGAAAPRVEQFTVDRAELAVDGFDVRATIDGQDALFHLQASGRTYRIVDVLADPTSPGVAAIGTAS